ncbi:MAG: carboxypeptidase-like regulatory domain-containing protein [Bacteroidota bacterium]
MRGLFLCCVLLYSISVSAQSQRVLSGKVIDVESKEPLGHVNIKLLESDIGTSSTASGHFILSVPDDELGPNEVLQISMLGYETRRISGVQLQRFSSNPITIALSSSPYQLSEVEIAASPREKKTIGHRNFTSASMGYWEGKEAIGGEIASVVPIPDKKTKLLNLQFKVIENRLDSLKVRVKFYDYDGGEPRNLITEANIVHTITQKEGLVTIPLGGHGIRADQDILVGIELVEAYGSSVYFSLSASAYGGLSFIREPLMPFWRPQKTTCVGFKIRGSTPIKRRETRVASKQR